MSTIKDLRPITPRTNGTRPISSIRKIARHYSATSSGSFASFWRHWNGTLGWGTGGYHEIILPDGTVELCYDPHEITNGVGGQNSYIYNICLVSDGTFTAIQEKVWEERVRYWMKRLGLSVADVLGHNEFPGQSTACPGTNMTTVRAKLRGQSSSASSDFFHLEYGDVGERVRLYQEKLKRAGYEIEVDGSFGPAMRTIVQQFQRDNGLVVDGLLGPASQKRLNEILLASKKEEVDEMAQRLGGTQRKDMKALLKRAYDDKVFFVDHTSKVDTMTRGQAVDLMISYVARTAK